MPAGTRLAEFEVQALMGVGGFGMVYRAYDHSLHRTVAIKEYMPGVLAGREGTSVVLRVSADEKAFGAGLRSFMAEARLLAQFDHPSLVKVFRVWEQNRTAYMVMPFYQGMTLKQAREQMRTAPPEAWLRQLLWSVLEALKLLHRHHTLHRDISPDNIFLQDIGPPVLLDLGAARRALGDRSQRYTAILKVNYAPIEQYADAEDMRQGPWSDLYALAAVVHGCLCNAPPLPATFRVLRDRMPSMAAVADGLQAAHGLRYSPAFVEALGRCLALQPTERPHSVAALVELLQLQPQADMERFDWRAELGEVWEPSRRAADAGRNRVDAAASVPSGARTDGATAGTPPPSSEQHPYAATVVWPAPAGRLGASRADAAPVPVARPRRWWMAGLVALVVGSLAGLGNMLAQAPPQPAPAGPAAVMPVAPAPTVAPPASALVTPTPAAAPRATPRPAAPRALTADQLCPDSNLLTRPMCLARECRKPAYAAMPVCVESLRRWQEGQTRPG